MIGVVCGMEAERTVLRGIKNLRVAVSAARPEMARNAARELADGGVSFLLSFGMAAGLKSGAASGDVFVARKAVYSGKEWECGAAQTKILLDMMPFAFEGSVYCSDVLLSGAGEKKKIFEETGCEIADVESRCVAEAAAERGIPFAVLRVVADTHDMNLPRAAALPLNENGKPDYAAIALSVVSAPSQMPDLIRLGCAASSATSGLRKAARVLRFAF